MTNLAQFQTYMDTLHERELNSSEHGTDSAQTMYNCVTQLGENIFSYAYDALCVEVLRFNEDGTVDEWADAAENDHENYEPHFHHASIEEWMKFQLDAVKMPN